ncbi:plastocyanin/azurin family copper-binding protein [Halosimplex marinum]|uniref:plastocyanin/azurin family copper-binding protein n=1 Tax=Halosimplex marinum TaxID=3396620 RepID=UPI003F563847
MNRRTYLVTVGSTVSGLSVGLAGCEGAPGAGVEETDTDGEESPSPTAEPTETGTDPDAGTETDTAAGTAGQVPNTVEMVTEGSDYYFTPLGLYVEPGETITWINESGSHSSTAYAESLDAASVTRIPEGAEPWNSGVLSEAGATFEHTFEETGTYDYFCIPHAALGMVGRLVVGEPGGPATEGQPPNGELPSSEAIVEQGAISYDEFAN